MKMGGLGVLYRKKERRVTKEQRRVSSPAKGRIELNESTARTATVWAEGEVSLSTSTGTVHVPGMKNPNTGVILEPEFCMVNHSCLSKSHTKFRLQDPPCVRVLHAGDLYLA